MSLANSLPLSLAESIKKLVPKSFHFDAYNELNCPNSRAAPIFSHNIIEMDEYYLRIDVARDDDAILLLFDDALNENCRFIQFEPYYLTLDELASKLKQAIQDNCDFICLNIKRLCSEKTSMAAISFNINDVKEAFSEYYGIMPKVYNNNNGGTTTMAYTPTKKKNGFCGLNFEFGMSKDSNIASTLMGVAVKDPTSGNWFTFDPATNTRKNMASLKLGNLPIFLLPTKELEVGMLIKTKDGSYDYVKSINDSSNTITWISATDGSIRETLNEESLIPGMKFYTRVVALDVNTFTDSTSKENMSGNLMAAMCMMQWSENDGSEFSLDNVGAGDFNGMGAMLPILAMSGNLKNVFGSNTAMSLPMIMALGNNGDNDQMTQMLVLSQLLGNNTSAAPIPGLNIGVPTEANEVTCTKCNKNYSASVAFCPKCGTKTTPIIIGASCKKCGVKLMDGAEFCHKCGTKVAGTICAKCGKKLESDENFCSKCGHPAGEPVISETKATEQLTASPDEAATAPPDEAAAKE